MEVCDHFILYSRYEIRSFDQFVHIIQCLLISTPSFRLTESIYTTFSLKKLPFTDKILKYNLLFQFYIDYLFFIIIDYLPKWKVLKYPRLFKKIVHIPRC